MNRRLTSIAIVVALGTLTASAQQYVAAAAARHIRIASSPGRRSPRSTPSTKDTYSATTTAEGYFNIQFVRAGTYEITISLSGFQKLQGDRRRSRQQQVVRTNAVLKVGGVTESVNVEAKAQVLNDRQVHRSPRQSASVRAIVELPLNGRNVWNLSATTHSVPTGRRQRYRFRGSEAPVSAKFKTACRSTASVPRPTSSPRPASVQLPMRWRRFRSRPAARRPNTDLIWVLDQRGHQERHQRAARVRALTSSRNDPLKFAGMVSRTRRIPKESAAQQSVWFLDRGADW